MPIITRYNKEISHEAYKSMCHDLFDNILKLPLINDNHLDKTEIQLYKECEQRSSIVLPSEHSLIDHIASSCRIILFQHVETKEYNGNEYKVLPYTSKFNKKQYFIKESECKYHSQIKNIIEQNSFNAVNTQNAFNRITTIDGHLVNINNINVGSDYLQAYSYSVINRFGKSQICHRIYSLYQWQTIDLDALLKKYILRTQAFWLNYIIKYPNNIHFSWIDSNEESRKVQIETFKELNEKYNERFYEVAKQIYQFTGKSVKELLGVDYE